MSETRTVLAKIAALRLRLDSAHRLAGEARSAAADLLEPLHIASQHDAELDETLRPLVGSVATGPLRSLTARARQILERGRDLLERLRALGPTLEHHDDGEPLRQLYADTVALIDTTIRTVALMPDSPSLQLHLCRGLEVALNEVHDRLRLLHHGEDRLRRRHEEVALLAEILTDLHAGQPCDTAMLRRLAFQLATEAEQGLPLHLETESPTYLPAFAAAHGLNTARVMARLIQNDPDWHPHQLDALVVSLVHDVGMLGVPSDMLLKTTALDEEARRRVESHSAIGERAVATLFQHSPELRQAVSSHHERLDGTGYPDGLRANQLHPLTRLLAVCDVYAALAVARPHRPARSSRNALADTLVQAEVGKLDRRCAEYLLRLTFYPVGTLVELASGAIAAVVATPRPMPQGNPDRPVVAVLTDADGQPLPAPAHRDLTLVAEDSIVRTLHASERRELLHRRLAVWAA
jgi:HD-GYP domain-containing protein (c-di-GMP phosphodiesterase class II)